MLNRILWGILFVMVGIIALTALIIWLAPFLAIGLTCYLVWRFAIRPNLLQEVDEAEIDLDPHSNAYWEHEDPDVLLLTDRIKQAPHRRQ
jgi:hypothetical protein